MLETRGDQLIITEDDSVLITSPNSQTSKQCCHGSSVHVPDAPLPVQLLCTVNGTGIAGLSTWGLLDLGREVEGEGEKERWEGEREREGG